MLDRVIDKIENKILHYLVKGLANILRVILSVLLFLSLVYVSFSYLNKSIREESSDYINFHALPENSMDVIVLGSSHAQYSFLPTLFNQQTGLYSFVLGSACQPYEVSYEMLKEALKTQSPELVIMEVFTATPLSVTCESDSCYVKAGYMMSGEERYNAFDYLNKEKAMSYRNDFLNNHNNWKDYDSFKEIVTKNDYTIDDLDLFFGYRWNIVELPPWNYWNPLKFNETAEVELEEIDRRMLDNIKKLCDDNSIQLMLYMVPMDGLDVINQSYRYKIWDWCNENGVLYQDQVQMAEDINYYMVIHNDGAHSFINGASLTTNELSKFIKKNFEFDNHQENDDLNRIFINSSGSTMVSTLKTEHDPLIYGQYFKGYKKMVILRYINKGNRIDPTFRQYVVDLGADEDFDKNNYYFAIINDGEIIHKSYEPGEVEYDGNVYTYYEQGYDINYETVDYQGDLSITLFSNNDSYAVKSIDTTKSRIWDAGINFYGDYEEN